MVPGYHYVLSLLLLFALGWSAWQAATAFSMDRFGMLVVVLALMVTAFYARIFALGTQDRIIRLEERLRLERLLPDDLKGRISELTTGQLIALRFASDGEVVDLTRRVLEGGLTDRKTIKQAVREWRADSQRI
jgi:hypothetical protein